MLLIKTIFIISSTAWVSCTITGLNYLDPLSFKSLKLMPSEEDACNPLLWYPKSIPEYCYLRTSPKSSKIPMPVPLPVPVPLQSQPLPAPVPTGPMTSMFPVPPPYPISPGYPMPGPPMAVPPLPINLYPPMPLPYGIPLAPTNPMLPVAGVPALPYPSPFLHYGPRYQAGMVPGIPGMVTHDGGVNILPFSDAYADLLEKHKQKMLRKKIKRVLDAYDGHSSRRENRRRRYRN